MKKIILIPIPTYGFDPSETAIPWKLLSDNNFEVVFATPNGTKAEGDKIMITGEGLGIFKGVLKARKDAVDAYWEMYDSAEFNNPIKYTDIIETDYVGVFLPGGHDKNVKEYLESTTLQKVIPKFFNSNKIVGAVCHSLMLLARSKNPETNESVIYDYKVTSLLKSQELLGYNLSRLWVKDYYLTYPDLTVEDEAISALKNKEQFLHGPQPLFRDTFTNLKSGFTVRDRNLITARWPGDIYSLVSEYINMLNE